MASLNSRIHPAPSHTYTHFLDSSVSDSAHADHMYGVDDAFFRMDLAHPGPGASPDPQGDCSSYDLRLHLEQALLNDCADVQLMSSLILDDAAAYAYGSPSSLLSTPHSEPLSQYAYDQWYTSSISQPLQSDSDMRQPMARGTIPAQSAYSTIADVYMSLSPPASTQQAASSSSSSYPSSSSLSSVSSYDSSNPEVISTPHRNTAVSPNARPVLSTDTTKCPFCPYVQRNMRDPDIRQHLGTHTRSSQYEDFTSFGVPLAEAKDIQSDLDMHQCSSISVDPWAAAGTIPVQNTYSTVVDAFGCCLPADVYAPASPSTSNVAPSPPSYYPALAASSPVSSRDASMVPGTIPVHSTIADALTCCPANVYAPTSPPTSTMAPSPPATATAMFSGRQAESTPESRQRDSSCIYQQAAFYSSYPSLTPSSSASSSYPSPSSSSASSSYNPPSPSSSASSSYSSPSPSSSASSSYPSPTSSSSSSSSSRDSSKPEVIFTPRRNTAVSPNARPVISKNPLKCQYCSYVAPKGRLPDLARHVNTHTRDQKDESFKCCGVPLTEAKERGLPTDRMKERPLMYQEIAMVGGCRKAFSRRDALLRHLRDNKGVCFGDAHAPYLLGNQ